MTAGDGDGQQHVYIRFQIAVNTLMMKDCLEQRGPLTLGQKPWKNSVEIFEKKVTDIQILSKVRYSATWGSC